MPTVVQQAIADASGARQVTLLDGVTALTDGKWVDIRGLRPITITVAGSGTAFTIQLLVSNRPTKPLDSDNNHPQLFDPITSTTAIRDDSSWRWIKARVTVITSATVSVDVLAG